MQRSLAADFAARKDFFSNRASAVFPLYFESNANDLIISFLNYWTIKNKIPSDILSVNLRIYTQAGDLYGRVSIRELQPHNSISIRDHVDEPVFHGMVEFEIISSENLGFNFPAITGIYRSDDLLSSVHSAGRIKSSDENQNSNTIEETNWNCKFGPNITPFFHYVNGPQKTKGTLEVRLYNFSGQVKDTRTLDIEFEAFSSKVFFANQIFSDNLEDDGAFVGVKCLNDNVFRRMVVGNYHIDKKHMEVTHSFSKQTHTDHCPEAGGEHIPNAFLAMYTDEALDLSARIFPTNCDSDYEVKARAVQSDQIGLQTYDNAPQLVDVIATGHGQVQMPQEIKFLLFELYGRVPSRFNTNFQYRYKKTRSIFSTDIATGAKSIVYPPKVTHWGSGIIGGGYEFVLMIRNNNHQRNSEVAKGTISIFGLNEELSMQFTVPSESSKNIRFSDFSDITENMAERAIHIFLGTLP